MSDNLYGSGLNSRVSFDDPNTVDRMRPAFPNPWFDYASTQMPRSIYEMMWWSQQAMLSDGTMLRALSRVIAYHLTGVQLDGVSEAEKEKWTDTLTHEVPSLSCLFASGLDRGIYGNTFVYAHAPFRRFLWCGRCVRATPIGKTDWEFVEGIFVHKCRACKARTPNPEPIDEFTIKSDKIKFIRVDPFSMRIRQNDQTLDREYFMELDPRMVADVKKGDPWILETTPWPFVKSAMANKLFRFNPGKLYHGFDPPPAGLKTGGWGMPPASANFRGAWYVRTMKRYAEAIGLDYTMAFRTVTPDGAAPADDPTYNTDLGEFGGQVMRMFAEHRRDPATVHWLPFPVKMNLMGAEARTLTPSDLIKDGEDSVLNAMGVPADFYRGTLQLQAAPTALRLFERTWTYLVNDMNGELRWMVEQIAALKNSEKPDVMLQPVTLADSLERKQLIMQLAAGGKISDETALKVFGLDYRDEFAKRLQQQAKDQEETQKAQQDVQKRMELQGLVSTPPPDPAAQAAQQGQQQGGQQGGAQGAPPAGQPAQAPVSAQPGGVTPGDMDAEALQIAQTVLAQPFALRRGSLQRLRQSDKNKHALVLYKMDEIRAEARRQGGAQMLAQMVGPGSAA